MCKMACLSQSGNCFRVLSLLLLINVLSYAEAALFDGCDNTYNIQPGNSWLESPYYPNTYPAGSSCRYKLVAPLDYQIQMNCTVELPQSGSTCGTESFFLSRDGDVQLRGSEQFCGNGQFVRNSVFRSAVLAYTSYGNRGRFRCSLYTYPQPCDCGWYANTRIVNGVQTRVNEYPSMAHLTNKFSSQPLVCAAAIISHRHSITAAHCYTQTPVSNLVLVVGDHSLSSNTETLYQAQYGVERILAHPGYRQDPDRNDIAIIFTTADIEWSRGVGPICLPPPSSVSNTFAYTYVDVVGWGTTSFAGPLSDTLQKVTLQVLQNSDCQATYNRTTIYSDQICTYDYTGTRKDSCQFDSGGPVIRRVGRQFLLGVISFGLNCGQGGYATGVNTRVSSYLQWIYANTGYSTCNVNM